jgi:nitrate reductase delta subunit
MSAWPGRRATRREDAGPGGNRPPEAAGRLTEGRRLVHQAAARCLAHPDDGLAADLALLEAALPGADPDGARLLRPFLDHAAATAPAALSAEYTEVFDFGRRHCLYLTWWSDGDTRARGAALVRVQDAYRRHGLAPAAGELPDFLPMVLEFTAATGSDALLRAHRPGLELLRLALAEHGTPYAHPLAAVCAMLPGPSPRDAAAARALARGGPPREDVGLAGLPPYGHLGLLPVLTGDH